MDIKQDIASLEIQSEKLDDLLDDLITEITARNYRITRINHIDNVFDRRKAGIDVDIGFKYYKIIEFCNLNSCSELISGDLRAGLFMPVRFVVYQNLQDQAVTISFLKPTAFAALFDSDTLMQVAVQLEQDMTDVLEELDY